MKRGDLGVMFLGIRRIFMDSGGEYGEIFVVPTRQKRRLRGCSAESTKNHQSPVFNFTLDDEYRYCSPLVQPMLLLRTRMGVVLLLPFAS